MRQADAMKNRGLHDAGYRYINIDDGFFGGRDANGNLLTHPVRFPNGLRHVVDHIHSLGMKAGIYSDAGRNTCGNYWDKDSIATGVGLYEHDSIDADFYFKRMGFDFIKVDFCGGDAKQNTESLDLNERQRYTEIAEAIRRTGRKDVKMNVCRWDYPGTWVKDVAASWRISHDIGPRWSSVKDIIGQSLYLSAYCRDGHYNDMDMLEIGRGMSEEEDKTHFGMWCMLSSPLMIGCDMEKASEPIIALLTNKELIALNQDHLHQQAYPVKYDNGCHVLVKDIKAENGKERAVAFYNPTDTVAYIEIGLNDVDLAGKATVRDLFAHRDSILNDGVMGCTLPPHATRIYSIVAEKRLPRTKYEAEAAYISDYQELDNNQAVLTGIYEPDAACSSGAKATWLGGKPENDLVWDNVWQPNKSKCTITVTGITPEARSVEVEIDGKPAGRMEFGPGRSEQSITATLKKGKSRIRLYNATDRMPDIDVMRIERTSK